MEVINTPEMRARKISTSYNTKKSKEAYPDGSKNTGRKVGYAAVFTDSMRRGTLPEEASIHTAEMTEKKIAMKEIKERERT